MKITREFAPADRYLYDFDLCSYANGWAQVDTAQDAWYRAQGHGSARIDPGHDLAMMAAFETVGLGDTL